MANEKFGTFQTKEEVVLLLTETTGRAQAQEGYN